MDENAGIVRLGDAGEQRFDDVGDRQAGGVCGMQAMNVERNVAHGSSARMITGKAHWISTRQPSFVHTECSLPTGLSTTVPAA